MSDLWSHRRRNTQSSVLDEASRQYLDVPPPSPRHRGRSQFRMESDASELADRSWESSSSSSPPSSASRIISTMRRSLSYSGTQKKRSSSLANIGMHSTPEESLPPSPSAVNAYDMRNVRPTVEQIAMGLHISRTPHLVPLHANGSRYRRRETADNSRSPSEVPSTPTGQFPQTLPHQRRGSAPPLMLPPPPPRSSLKIPGSRSPRSDATSPIPLTPSASDASLSSLTSAAPSTPRSNRSTSTAHFSTRLQLSMSKFWPGRKSSAPSSPTIIRSSDDDSVSSVLTPRKAVRFSPGVGVDNS
ncbi:unnamed protein product [Somion occarium]|uniref:Uncharacterized protein n=1 Tax=Somion occarium TaxID=3059160 RepID=A0ABP1E2H8_9APHY